MSEAPGTMMAWTKVHDTEDGFELIEHPVPSPAPGEVLVKTASTSICGTDLHSGCGMNGAGMKSLLELLPGMKPVVKL